MNDDNFDKNVSDFAAIAVSDEVREVLDGAVDLHQHPAPSPFPRRISIAQAADQAKKLGFKAIVAKSHHHSMVTDVGAVDAAIDLALPVYSGVTLNNTVGGLNPYAVDLALKMGARIVWFPTICSSQHIAEFTRLNFPTATDALKEPTEVSILDGSGHLKPEATQILEIIRDQDGVLAGGHLPADDLDALYREAYSMGIRNILCQHPNYVVGATPERAAVWAQQYGVVIEHSLCMYDDRSSFYHWKIDTLIQYLDSVGYTQSALVSDLGQRTSPLPMDSFVRILSMLMEAGIDKQSLRTIVCDTPTKVLGI